MGDVRCLFCLRRAPVPTLFIPSSIPCSTSHRYDFSPFSGRILMETPRLPTIIPMWITGALPNIPAPAHNEALTKSDASHPHPHPSPHPETCSLPQRPTGFDTLMPEGRRAPWKFFPRPGARLSVTFGAPLPTAAVGAALGMGQRVDVRGLWNDGGGCLYGKHQRTQAKGDGEVEARIVLTELMQRAVEGLGRQVSGDLLTGLPHQQQQRT
jgi:hypothetical protein